MLFKDFPTKFFRHAVQCLQFKYIIRGILLVPVIVFLFLSAIPEIEHKVLGVNLILGDYTRFLSARSSNSGELIAPVSKPVFLERTQEPLIRAEAAVVIDRKSFSRLYDKNAQTVKYPASTTKIATSVIAIEKMDLTETVTVPNDVLERARGSIMGLLPGDQVRRIDLVWGMLLSSGNDAAYTIAATYPQGEDEFIAEMNRLAARINLEDTLFTNPIGFDDYTHHTTPRDLALIASYAFDLPLFRQIAGETEKVVDIEGARKVKLVLKNTNLLLSKDLGVKAGKTGWTQIAGGVLVTLVERDGHEVIVVVMKSEEREKDTENLINWVYSNYKW